MRKSGGTPPLLLDLASVGGELLTSLPCRFTLEERAPVSYHKRRVRSQGRSGRSGGKKIPLPLSGMELQFLGGRALVVQH
jgi:hypothetical protein